MHYWTVMSYNMQKKLLWGFYTNKISTIPNYYESVLWLQSHILPCNFGETVVFWNPVQGGEGSVSRMCVNPGCHDPVFWPAELSEWTCICRTVWLVELAYRACVTDARNPDVNNSAVNLREYRTFDVIKSIAIECVQAQQGMRRRKYNFLVPWRIHGTVKPSSSDGPTQGPDWVTIASLTQARSWPKLGFINRLTSLIWPWRSWSIVPQNNRYHKQVGLHLLSKFDGSSLNMWWVMAWTSSKWGKLAFQVKFDLEGQSQSAPKRKGTSTKLFCTFCPNFVVLAWTRDDLWRGQARGWRTHTHRQTDAGNDNTQRPILSSGKNWD